MATVDLGDGVTGAPVDYDPWDVSTTPVDHDPFAPQPPPQAELKPYTPSWSERIGGAAQDAMSWLGASKTFSQDFGQNAQQIAGVVPGLGNALSANQAYRDYQGGDYLGAAINAAGAIPLPGTSVLGDAERTAEAAAPRIIAYHGSPHSFDQFDMSKIGTGEGAQAYGQGMYFAENEDTAKSYRDALAGGQYLHADDRPLGMYDPFAEIAAAGQKAGFDYKTANETSQQILQAMREGDDLGHMQNFVRQSDWDPSKKAAWNAALEEGQKYKWAGDKGSMYQVSINADPEHFLDWDKPLSEQSPHVQQHLADTLNYQKVPLKNNAGGETTGAQMMGYLKGRFGNDVDAAGELSESGIPGIKYLDQGSRTKGDGSRNYVVFDDKTINILKKYGLAGAGIATGAGALTQQPSDAEAATQFKLTPVDGDPFAGGGGQ